jgi:hypothetical protein
MSIQQQVECPECKHRHYVQMPVHDLLFERNLKLEQAFRDLMKICISHIPLSIDKEQP